LIMGYEENSLKHIRLNKMGSPSVAIER
jgi:hypothetical protein